MTEQRDTKSSTRRKAIRIIGTAGTVGVAGCLGSSGNSDSGGGANNSGGGTNGSSKIKIGLTKSSTGDFVYDSQKGYRGLKVWQQNINKNGGLKIDGSKQKVELVEYDDRSSKQRVTRLYNQLINEDNVDVLFAPFSSTLTSAAAAVANQNGKFIMAWGAGSPEIYNQGYTNLMSVDQPANQQPEGQMQVMSNAGVKTLAILHRDAANTNALSEAFENRSGNYDIEDVNTKSYSSETSDFSTPLRQIKSGDPDAIFLASYAEEVVNIIQQMKSNSIWFDWVHSIYSANNQIFEGLGNDAKYLFGWHNIHPDTSRNVNLGLSVSDFIKQYRNLFSNDTPTFNSANGYAAGLMTAECMKKAGTTDEVDPLIQAAKNLSGNVTVANGEFKIHPKKHYQTAIHYFATQNKRTDGESIFENIEVMGPKNTVEPTGEPTYPAPSWTDR